MGNCKHLISRKLRIAVILAAALALFAMSVTLAHASTYWLKVNQKTNVMTAYKYSGRKWKPVRAMLCTCGTTGKWATPNGTFYTGYKNRWLTMWLPETGYDYAQYTAHVTSDIFIHSVWYHEPRNSMQSTAAFNDLGKSASHGCIRLSVADAKWVYDNCLVGTKITIFRGSKKRDPLGKPKRIKNTSKSKYSWDPTDPASGNPNRGMMPKPVITTKSKKLKIGAKYNLKKGVKAIDPNSFYDLTKYIKVKKIQKWSKKKGEWTTVKKLSTKKAAKYRVKYFVDDPWGRSASKWRKITVYDPTPPKEETQEPVDPGQGGETDPGTGSTDSPGTEEPGQTDPGTGSGETGQTGGA